MKLRKVKKKPILESVVIDEIYDAVKRYVELHGGKLVVIGGLEIQQWPTDPPMTFRVAVRCTGKKPHFVKQVQP